MKMWKAPLMILSALILLVSVTPFEHPGRMHHRRPPQEPSEPTSPEETEVSYHSEESVPWRTQVTKRRGKPGKDEICIKTYEFAVGNQDILTSTCKYKVINDYDSKRLPNKIPMVECVNTGCRCSDRGDYRCTQLITPMEVIILDDFRKIDPFNHTVQTIKVKSACVCAVTRDNKIMVIQPSTYKK